MEQYAEKMAELLRRLDGVRVELCTLTSEMKEYQSSYDKNDQSYLHQLEDIDTSNYEEMQRMIESWKSSRTGRRNVKGLIKLASETIDKIPYKNYTNALPILKENGYIVKRKEENIGWNTVGHIIPKDFFTSHN